MTLDSDEDVDESQITIDEKKKLHDELPIIQFYGHSAAALPGKGRNDSNKSSTDNEPYFADLIKFLKGSLKEMWDHWILQFFLRGNYACSCLYS